MRLISPPRLAGCIAVLSLAFGVAVPLIAPHAHVQTVLACVTSSMLSSMPHLWRPDETPALWTVLLIIMLGVWVVHFYGRRTPHAIAKEASRKAAYTLKMMEAVCAYQETDLKRATKDQHPPEAARVLMLLWDDIHERRTYTYGFCPDHSLNRRCETLYCELAEKEMWRAVELTSLATGSTLLPTSAKSYDQKEIDDHQNGMELQKLLLANDKVCAEMGASFGVDSALIRRARLIMREAVASQKGNLRLLFAMVRPIMPTLVYATLIDITITALRAYFHQLGTWMACIEAGVRGDLELAYTLLWRQWVGHMLIKILEVPESTYLKHCRSSFGNAIRRGTMSAMVGQDFDYFERTSAGVLQERLNRDADELGENLVDFPKKMLTRITWVGSNLFLVYTQAPGPFFTVACLPVLGMMVFQFFVFKVFRRCDELARKVEEEGISATSEVLANIKTVRQFAAERSSAATYSRRALSRQLIGEAVFAGKRVLEAAAWCLFDTGITYTVVLGFPYVASGQLTAGQLMDCFCKLNFNINFCMREILEELPRASRLLEPLGRICSLLQSTPTIEPTANQLSYTATSSAELDGILKQCTVQCTDAGEARTRVATEGVLHVARGAQLTHVATADHEHIAVADWRDLQTGAMTFPVRAIFSQKLRPARIRGKIEFRDVHFAFPTELRKPILNGISFTVEPGQKVALVGPTGCGKSCCMKLLQRLYEPSSGVILIDDIPIQEYDIHHLRSRVVIVDQHTVLFSCTIRDNVTFGLEHSVSDEEVVQACKAAQAWDFIDEMPDKLMTVLNAGDNLSGGQQQRLAIARAIIRNPDVILLDEATSALDNQNEAKVQQALDELARRGSALVIAHRLSTIKDSDQILVVEHGRVAESGTHETLLARADSTHGPSEPPLISRQRSPPTSAFPPSPLQPCLVRQKSAPDVLLTLAAEERTSYRQLWRAAEGGTAKHSLASLEAMIRKSEEALAALKQTRGDMMRCKTQLLASSTDLVAGLLSPVKRSFADAGGNPRDEGPGGSTSPSAVMDDLTSSTARRNSARA